MWTGAHNVPCQYVISRPEVLRSSGSLEGSTDPDPFQVMDACLPVTCPIPAASRNSQSAHLDSRSHWNGKWAILLPDTPCFILREASSKDKVGHPACKLGILGHAVSSQQPKDAEARAGALPLTGSRRFPLLPRVDVPTTRFDIRRKGSEAVKRRTRDVDAGLLATCGCLPASVRCAYVRIGKVRSSR